MATRPETQLAYRQDIDGLRALAILGVVSNHLRLGAPGGHTGVDVFFVISGWLITTRIEAALVSQSFSLREFWSRRLLRLMPAYLVMLAATMVAAGFVLLPSLYSNLAATAVWQTVFLSNCYLYLSLNYFAPTAIENPLIHAWSLAVEEQFYLLYPVLFTLLRRYSSALLHATVAVLICASYGTSVLCVLYAPQAAFYLLPSRVWELGLGAFLAMHPLPPIRNVLWRNLVAIGGFLGILIPFFSYDETTPFPGANALPSCVGTAVLIWAHANGSTVVGRLLSLPLIVFVGKVSYSLYLIHWPLVSLGTLGGWICLENPLHGLLVFVASCGLATLSWRFVEQPFRRNYNRNQSRVLGITVLTSACSLLFCSFIIATDGWPQRLPADIRKMVEIRRIPLFDSQLDEGELLPLKPFGADKLLPDVFLYGDSHAEVVFSLFDKVSKKHGLAGVASWSAGRFPGTSNPGIKEMIGKASIKDVFLVARWQKYAFSASGSPGRDVATNQSALGQTRHEPTQEFEKALRQTIVDLTTSGARVWFVKQMPEYSFSVPQALLSGSDGASGGVTRDEYDAKTRLIDEIVHELSGEGSVILIDASPKLFQGRDHAALVINGKAAYSDGDHLTVDAVDYLFREPIEAAMEGIRAREKTSP